MKPLIQNLHAPNNDNCYFQKENIPDLSIIELQMLVYERENVEYLLFKNSVSLWSSYGLIRTLKQRYLSISLRYLIKSLIAGFCILERTENMKIVISFLIVLLWAN